MINPVSGVGGILLSCFDEILHRSGTFLSMNKVFMSTSSSHWVLVQASFDGTVGIREVNERKTPVREV